MCALEDTNYYYLCIILSKENNLFGIGVIGIKVCDDGGERVVFPTVSRDKVESVEAVVSSFSSHPDRIHSVIHNNRPTVVNDPTAGVLLLFNGVTSDMPFLQLEEDCGLPQYFYIVNIILILQTNIIKKFCRIPQILSMVIMQPLDKSQSSRIAILNMSWDYLLSFVISIDNDINL